MTDARASRQHAEALVKPTAPDRRVSTERAEVLINPPDPDRRTSTVRVEVLVGPPNVQRVSTLRTEVAVNQGAHLRIAKLVMAEVLIGPALPSEPGVDEWDAIAGERRPLTLLGQWDTETQAIAPVRLLGVLDGGSIQSLD